ncbi:hypothetical protein ACFL18_01355 [Patescibacteria group bacterium]
MPDDQILSTDSPLEDLDRFARIVDLAKNHIGQKTETILDQSINKSLPRDFRLKLIHYSASQIAQDALKALGQTPNLDSAEYQAAYKNAIDKALKIIDETNTRYSDLVSSKAKQFLQTELEELDQFKDPEKVKQAAQTVHQQQQTRQQKLTDSQETARSILDKIPRKRKYALKQDDTVAILHHLRNQPDVINNPTQDQIKISLEELSENPDTNIAVKEFSKQLLKHSDEIHHYVLTATDPLPTATTFTPWQSKITPKILRQAKALNTSPLAVAYTTTGFSATDPRLSKDLQQEIAHLQQIITNPTNPQHQLSFRGVLQAYQLQPHLFIAQNYYQPLYQKIQQLQVKSNQVLKEPFKVYQAANQQYTKFQNAYQTIKTQKKAGWLIAPRYRARLAWHNTKLKVKRWTRYQILKSQNRRRLYRKTRNIRISLGNFWTKWSPRGIRKRAFGWVKEKSLDLTARFGGWLVSKGYKKLGGLFTQAAALAAGTASIVGLPMVALGLTFSFAKTVFRKIRQKMHEQKDIAGSANMMTSAFYTILNGLKALLSLMFGTAGGIIGAIAGGIIGFFVGGGLPGLIVGAISGSLVLGSLGALAGFNFPNLAILPLSLATGMTSIFSGLTATSTPVIAISGATAITIPFYLTQQNMQTINSAFYLPTSAETKEQQTVVGQITQTCANTSNIFVWQRDPSWSNTPCPNNACAANCASRFTTCTIGLSGCGSASMTMILNSFGANTNIESVWQKQHKIGGYTYPEEKEKTSCGTTYYPNPACSGSRGGLQILRDSGLNDIFINKDWQEAEKILQNCGLILTAGVQIYDCGEQGKPKECHAGHILVITGIVKNKGKITHIETMDPWFSNGNKLIQDLEKDYQVNYMWGVMP